MSEEGTVQPSTEEKTNADSSADCIGIAEFTNDGSEDEGEVSDGMLDGLKLFREEASKEERSDGVSVRLKACVVEG